jgi:transcription antitermination factor NusG
MAVACAFFDVIQTKDSESQVMDQRMNKVTDAAPQSWFALNTKFMYEDYVARQVRGRGYEVYLPIYKCRRRWSDRIKEIDLPLFPGYLFCRFNPSARLPILTTPGLIQIVGIGKTPIPIDDNEITAIQIASESRLEREPWPYLQVGQKVRVECGPLCGVEGILLNFKGQHRLVLSVTLLQRSIAVEVDSAWVSSVTRQTPAGNRSAISSVA